MVSEFFTQYEVETAFWKLLRSGDETAIGVGVQKTRNWISKLFNPGGGPQSPLFQAAAILAAWTIKSPVRGKKALRLFVQFVEKSTSEKDTSPGAVVVGAVQQLQEDFSDVIGALENVPEIRLQMRELVHSRHAR